ncbi:helix-turn-helix transcriptional regulator [Listeria monocytogenes]|uniref:helix-turn-helix domain-containing protein n=1 Tax=Listeria monocytogenes TaxID=1639 RepID=UPI0010F14543|nr:helix-turn-helix transcriptional regulator [Listeria monocytogenes]EAD2655811.1 XRE family transcriptional regulator [Listeria monocytogenes]EHY0679218.1 helix-turn-helix transcriptional regulator [Listeria monocytogenes]EIM0414917.1 helix-turn-helix transcriptional regulator [Listeria monocytogenes]EIM0799656.1 helix-turn-helix transcriptional regulator [Listeria monocytogenes]EIM1267568.1 helix-turn-helix transcriptional regulator [Listeria monocytogenes]
MSIKFRVGHVIKKIRSHKGYSQAELCKGICSVNALARAESNETSPSFEILFALLDRLGVSIEKVIAEANLEEKRLFIQQKLAMEHHMESYDLVSVKESLKLIDDVTYNNLSIREQQFIDIMKVEVLTHIEGQGKKAKLLAEAALYKSYKEKANYFSDEEVKLINIILRFEQSNTNIRRAEKALLWLEKEHPYLQNRYLMLYLINGLMITEYLNENWRKVLEMSAKGLQIAEKEQGMKFIPNFLFLKGLSLYMLNIEQDKGKVLMQESFKICELTNHMYVREGLLDTVTKYNIIL